MKYVFAFGLALLLGACSGVAQQDYDAAISQVETLQQDLDEAVSQNESLQRDLDERTSNQDFRDYYDSQALGSPSEAVEAFAGAFQRGDYSTVYFILDVDSQRQAFRSIQQLQYGDFMTGFEPELLEGALGDIFENIEEEFLVGQRSWFTEVMTLTAERDGFRIDLRGSVDIGEEAAGPTLDEDRSSTDVVTTVEGIEGEVIFRMVQSASGKWRVYQIIVEGGDETRIPFSAVFDE